MRYRIFARYMGSCLSCLTKSVSAVVSMINMLPLNFTQEQWNQAYNSGTIEEGTTQLWELGTDLKKIDDSSLPSSVSRAVLIACNTYTKPEYSLGVGPMNDAITVASYMGSIGTTVYFIHNPTSVEFLKYLKYFLTNTTDVLTVYYTGHGTRVDDVDGDEHDGKDEAFVFDDAFVTDDVLAQYLSKYKTSKSAKVVLINDCCHSGTIWDLNQVPSVPNIMSLSAACDTETAKQTEMDGKDRGIFTFYLFKLLSSSPTMSLTELNKAISPYLKKFDQQFTFTATTSSLESESIFRD